MHTSYETKFTHPADFRVTYRFYSQAEGGRQTIPHQGYRSDFWYEHPDNKSACIFMIWPEFENEEGEIILEKDISVAQQGTARMWVLFPEGRAYHRNKIKPGVKAYFMEGPRKVAECEVLEVLGLNTNQVIQKK